MSEKMTEGLRRRAGAAGEVADAGIAWLERQAKKTADMDVPVLSGAAKALQPLYAGARAAIAHATSGGGKYYQPEVRDERYFSNDALRLMAKNLARHGGRSMSRYDYGKPSPAMWEASQAVGGATVKDGKVTDTFDVDTKDPYGLSDGARLVNSGLGAAVDLGHRALGLVFGDERDPAAGKVRTEIPLDAIRRVEVRQDAKGGDVGDEVTEKRGIVSSGEVADTPVTNGPRIVANSRPSHLFDILLVKPKEDDMTSQKAQAAPRSATPTAGGGPRIVINPAVFKDKRDALCVAFNEAFRIIMELNDFEPVSEPTPEQRKFFEDTAYADDELQLRRTIIARIATLDTSVKHPTDEQLQETVEFLHTVMELGAPQNEWEQQAVQRLADLVEMTPKRGGAASRPKSAGAGVHAAAGGGEADDPLKRTTAAGAPANLQEATEQSGQSSNDDLKILDDTQREIDSGMYDVKAPEQSASPVVDTPTGIMPGAVSDELDRQANDQAWQKAQGVAAMGALGEIARTLTGGQPVSNPAKPPETMTAGSLSVTPTGIMPSSLVGNPGAELTTPNLGAPEPNGPDPLASIPDASSNPAFQGPASLVSPEMIQQALQQTTQQALQNTAEPTKKEFTPPIPKPFLADETAWQVGSRIGKQFRGEGISSYTVDKVKDSEGKEKTVVQRSDAGTDKDAAYVLASKLVENEAKSQGVPLPDSKKQNAGKPGYDEHGNRMGKPSDHLIGGKYFNPDDAIETRRQQIANNIKFTANQATRVWTDADGNMHKTTFSGGGSGVGTAVDAASNFKGHREETSVVRPRGTGRSFGGDQTAAMRYKANEADHRRDHQVRMQRAQEKLELAQTNSAIAAAKNGGGGGDYGGEMRRVGRDIHGNAIMKPASGVKGRDIKGNWVMKDGSTVSSSGKIVKAAKGSPTTSASAPATGGAVTTTTSTNSAPSKDAGALDKKKKTAKPATGESAEAAKPVATKSPAAKTEEPAADTKGKKDKKNKK